jgi:hypothetical protein
MRMTRHPARSFTFEIKRANKRTPEVLTLSKISSPEGSSLANQVFGKLSVRSPAPQAGKIKVPTSVRPVPSFGIDSPEAFGKTEPSAERSARRVLPDLLSAPVTPLEERVQREADERAARRKASRMKRAKGKAERSSVTATREDAPSTAVATTMGTTTEPVIANNQLLGAVSALPQETVQRIKLVATSRKRKRNALRSAFKKAGRNGRPVPRLPAGQRWKRRLPQACW